MKTLCSWLAISGALLLVNTGEISAQTTNTENTTIQHENGVWKKSPNGATWKGQREGTAYWYKVGSDGKIVSSTDNKEWAPVMNNTWSDNDGKWYRFTNAHLLWSNDGKVWVEAPNEYWRGADGMWYMMDGDWTLWNGGTSETAPALPAKPAQPVNE